MVCTMLVPGLCKASIARVKQAGGREVVVETEELH